MKRDFDLLKEILLAMEEDRDPFEGAARSPFELVYHCELAIEAGLIKGMVIPDSSDEPSPVVLQRLTMDGHDFLDNARNETVWNTAKGKLTSFGGACSLEVFKKLLVKLVSDQLLG